MDIDRITHPLRLAKGSHQPGTGKGCAMNGIIGKVLVGAVGAAISLGLAAPAGASPVIPQPQECSQRLRVSRQTQPRRRSS